MEEEEKRIARVDAEEVEIIKKLKEKAAESWAARTTEHSARIKKMQEDQATRLAKDQSILNSAIRNTSEFDCRAFEFIVDKCGKGRSSAYGREKMSRFWEVYDRMHGASAGSGVDRSTSSVKEQQEILDALKGIKLQEHEHVHEHEKPKSECCEKEKDDISVE